MTTDHAAAERADVIRDLRLIATPIVEITSRSSHPGEAPPFPMPDTALATVLLRAARLLDGSVNEVQERATTTMHVLAELRREMDHQGHGTNGRAVAARCLRIVENAVRGVSLARSARPDEQPTVMGLGAVDEQAKQERARATVAEAATTLAAKTAEPPPGMTPVVTLTPHDVDPNRILGNCVEPIHAGHHFLFHPDTITYLAARVNAVHKALLEAREAGQKLQDEAGLWRRNTEALQARMDRIASEQRPQMNDIGYAKYGLLTGHRMRRVGWNGKGMYIVMVPTDQWTVGAPMQPGERRLPWVGMRTADGGFVPWLCSQTDLLAQDWEIAD
jgi:hypothetical protein